MDGWRPRLKHVRLCACKAGITIINEDLCLQRFFYRFLQNQQERSCFKKGKVTISTAAYVPARLMALVLLEGGGEHLAGWLLLNRPLHHHSPPMHPPSAPPTSQSAPPSSIPRLLEHPGPLPLPTPLPQPPSPLVLWAPSSPGIRHMPISASVQLESENAQIQNISSQSVYMLLSYLN